MFRLELETYPIFHINNASGPHLAWGYESCPRWHRSCFQKQVCAWPCVHGVWLKHYSRAHAGRPCPGVGEDWEGVLAWAGLSAARLCSSRPAEDPTPPGPALSLWVFFPKKLVNKRLNWSCVLAATAGTDLSNKGGAGPSHEFPGNYMQRPQPIVLPGPSVTVLTEDTEVGITMTGAPPPQSWRSLRDPSSRVLGQPCACVPATLHTPLRSRVNVHSEKQETWEPKRLNQEQEANGQWRHESSHSVHKARPALGGLTVPCPSGAGLVQRPDWLASPETGSTITRRNPPLSSLIQLKKSYHFTVIFFSQGCFSCPHVLSCLIIRRKTVWRWFAAWNSGFTGKFRFLLWSSFSRNHDCYPRGHCRNEGRHVQWTLKPDILQALNTWAPIPHHRPRCLRHFILQQRKVKRTHTEVIQDPTVKKVMRLLSIADPESIEFKNHHQDMPTAWNLFKQCLPLITNVC